MTDEEREADSDGSQEGGLVLDGGQHDDCQHQLCCGEHFNEESPRDGTVSSKSDVDRHRSREERRYCSGGGDAAQHLSDEDNTGTGGWNGAGEEERECNLMDWSAVMPLTLIQRTRKHSLQD